MKKKLFASVLLLLLFGKAMAQKHLFPVIKHYGGIADVPNAIDKPDSTIDYNIIIEAGSKIEYPDSVYDPFETICRMYNLHIYGGVKPEHLHIDVVVYGEPTQVALDNEHYKKKFGVDNPNIKIIEEMKQAGINIYVCGQSVVAKKIDPTSINPNAEVVFSRLTTVTTRQMKGYAFFKF